MSKDVSRRTLVRSAAWSLPVIAAVVATPLAAGSKPTCPDQGLRWFYDPTDYPGNGSMGPNHNVATIEVIVGVSVKVTFIKRYNNATALNVNGKIVHKWDSGAMPGASYTHILERCDDPTFIQIDGNNTHYYGGGVFR